MVGVPTSKGCETCRKRKKKCGEQRPSCNECVRSGWECPGYKNIWKFVDENTTLSKHYSKRRYVYDLCFAGRKIQDFESLNDELGVLVWELHSRSEIPRSNQFDKLASTLVYSLNSKVKGRLVPLRLVGSFFDFIPSRLGHNQALDDAVSCLCLIYTPPTTSVSEFHKSIVQSYVKALSSLRVCLEDPILWHKAETLCASILLQKCELVLSVGRGEWSNLTRGTSKLIQSRGVDRYTDSFDFAMLEAQLPHIASHALHTKEPCFFSEEKWRAILCCPPTHPYQATQSISVSLRTQLLTMLSPIPTLVLGIAAMHPAQIPPGSIDQMTILLSSIQTWIRLNLNPILYHTDTTISGIYYPDFLAAVVDCVAHTSLVSVTNALRSLHEMTTSPARSPFDQQSIPTVLSSDETIEEWKQHAINAYNFVKGQSSIAAKPLEFGIQALQNMPVPNETDANVISSTDQEGKCG